MSADNIFYIAIVLTCLLMFGFMLSVYLHGWLNKNTKTRVIEEAGKFYPQYQNHILLIVFSLGIYARWEYYWIGPYFAQWGGNGHPRYKKLAYNSASDAQNFLNGR